MTPPNEELSKSFLPILALRERRAKKSFANMDISSTKRYLIGFQNSSFAFASSLNVEFPDDDPVMANSNSPTKRKTAMREVEIMSRSRRRKKDHMD